VTVDQVLPIVLPLIALQLALVIWALYDLTRPTRRVRGDSKLLWGGVIILGELLGPILYFMWGRLED
jgi:hypothetical protein